MIQAMLFKEVDANDTAQVEKLIGSPNHVAEQKMDGARLLVDLGELLRGDQAFYQRNGQQMKFSAAKLKLPALREDLMQFLDWGSVTEHMVLDGELIIETGEYRVWDLVILNHLGLPYIERRSYLNMVLGLKRGEFTLVHLVKSEILPSEKRALLERVYKGGGEGLMFKDLREGYDPGVRTKHSLKVKFVKAAEVIIVSKSEDPLSAELGVIVDDSGAMEKVGRTSLIGKEATNVGDVIEILYLFWTGSAVYQPRMVRVRHDKIQSDCTKAQFTPYSRDVM